MVIYTYTFNIQNQLKVNMGVSKNSGTPISSILIGFSILNHPFWGIPISGTIHGCYGYEDPMIFGKPGHKLASDGTDNHLVLWDRFLKTGDAFFGVAEWFLWDREDSIFLNTS